MQFLMAFRNDEQPFPAVTVQRLFESNSRFRDLRFHEPGGAVLEAVYARGEDSSIVRLSGDLDTVTFSGDSQAALEAALLLQQHVDVPLRIVDSDYSFDLTLANYDSLDAFEAAVDRAREE